MVSVVSDFATLRTVACQGPLSMGFSRQAYWSGLPWIHLSDPLDQGIEPTIPVSPALQAGSLHNEPAERSEWKDMDILTAEKGEVAPSFL